MIHFSQSGPMALKTFFKIEEITNKKNQQKSRKCDVQAKKKKKIKLDNCSLYKSRDVLIILKQNAPKVQDMAF